ncbi:MAG: TIR domain-containing protein [Clostridia bacterium]|nr:TIR domain-containing protein [Clostridia bacterium]
MAVFKCKMCGGDLRIIEGQTVCECEYCGSRQTVPMLDSEKKVTLFARANRLRSMCEFDKAYSVYESIVADFPEEAEAYWGLVLCKYGIEYVDDPMTGKKIPTCHRSSFDNVMEDGNFELVMEYSDVIARPVYRDEAKEIERIRSGILEVSSKEEPYDIFICYKETDDKGDRTVDSLIAQDVYDALTEKGYRVFFSRISLEDKLGQEYEPYIFAALHSAQIMLVFGTNYDNFNAVWVKNEWGRYLSLIAKGEKKTLIPCYKDVDAYDIPQEFRKLQAQDMGKVGAIQDLLRGIGKILPKQKREIETPANIRSVQQDISSVPLKRAFAFLEDGDWARADEYLEKALDHDPDNATAFLGKLLIEMKLPTKERLKYQAEPFDNSNNYKRILRLGDERLINELEEDLKQIKKHIETEQQKAETARNEAIYANAMELMNSQMIWRASELFESIGSYKDASEKALECRKRAEAIRKKGALQQKQAMETELSNLKGPFASRRRKELEAIIDKLDKQIQSMNSKLNSLSR